MWSDGSDGKESACKAEDLGYTYTHVHARTHTHTHTHTVVYYWAIKKNEIATFSAT